MSDDVRWNGQRRRKSLRQSPGDAADCENTEQKMNRERAMCIVHSLSNRKFIGKYLMWNKRRTNERPERIKE